MNTPTEEAGFDLRVSSEETSTSESLCRIPDPTAAIAIPETEKSWGVLPSDGMYFQRSSFSVPPTAPTETNRRPMTALVSVGFDEPRRVVY